MNSSQFSLISMAKPYKTIFNNEVIGILIFDYDGILVDANNTFFKIFGYDQEDLNSKLLSWQKLTPLEYHEITTQQIDKLRKTGQLGPYEKEYIHKDGSRSWLLLVGSDLNDGTFIEFFFDISRRIKTEKALRKSEMYLMETRNLLTMATQASKIGWAFWNQKTGIITWDELGLKMMGLKKKENKVKDWLLHIYPEDRHAFNQHLREALEKKESLDIVFRVIRPDGKTRHIHGTGIFEITENKSDIKGTGLFRDVTEEYQLQRLKDDFLAIVSHELKTPVSVMKGYVEMIMEELKIDDPLSHEPFLIKVNHQIDKINFLINDLLDVNRIENGRLDLHTKVFEFDKLVNEVIDSLHYISSHKLKLSGYTGKQIEGDPDRIGQVIINLIINAVKFSPKSKEVLINLSTQENKVILTVKDHGIGIPQKQLNKVFDRFSRVNSEYNKFMGLGIGLFISAEIIKRHNGRIWVKSKKGKGSEFSFSLTAISPNN